MSVLLPFFRSSHRLRLQVLDGPSNGSHQALRYIHDAARVLFEHAQVLVIEEAVNGDAQ